MTSPQYRIGTRKSALATTQSEQIRSLLKQQGIACELFLIESSGDLDRKTPLYEIEAPSPGLFTKQLEVALLEGRIDLAVHSLKDLPTEQPPQLKVACTPTRVAVEDCLIQRKGLIAKLPLGLPLGARVGTSSLRREAQLLSARPDLNIVPIRGNVPTRVDLVRRGEVDAVVLAEAGLFRLGLDLNDLIKLTLPKEAFVPAPGQGALAVEVRHDCPSALAEALTKFHDRGTERETRVERRILRELEGGCTLPLGVHCRFDRTSQELQVQAFLGLREERTAGRAEWLGFPRFDIRGKEEEAVVASTVNHFRDVAKKV